MLKLRVNATVIHLQVGIHSWREESNPTVLLGWWLSPTIWLSPKQTAESTPSLWSISSLVHCSKVRAITLNSPSICSQVQQTWGMSEKLRTVSFLVGGRSMNDTTTITDPCGIKTKGIMFFKVKNRQFIPWKKTTSTVPRQNYYIFWAVVYIHKTSISQGWYINQLDSTHGKIPNLGMTFEGSPPKQPSFSIISL